MKTCSFKNITV